MRIVDFGIAKLANQTRLTQVGKAVGTLAYMSPEQLRSLPVDQRTDIWSLGVVMHEMVTGQLPFPSEHDSVLVQAILNQESQPLTALRTGVPVALDQIVTKAMAKGPADRYQHAEEIPVDLRAIGRAMSRASSGYRSTTLIDIPRSPSAAPLAPPETTAARTSTIRSKSCRLCTSSTGWIEAGIPGSAGVPPAAFSR